MGRRGRPPKRPASATSSAEQHMKRVRDICINSRFVNIGENGKKWQQHRRSCEGSQPGFDFVGHLLSLHDVHCSRAPPENVDVKLEVDDEALHGDNGSLDEVRVSLDGDLARQWRHLQKLAGYEAAEMEYLCWLMTVAEQMLGWKSPTAEKDTDDRAEEQDEDYTPEPPRQRRRRTEPTAATAGPSFDTPEFDASTDLPEYGDDGGDDSNSGSAGVPSRHADSEEEEEEDEDVKPDLEPAQGTLTKFTIKWADKPSTSTAPTSIETETTSMKGKDSLDKEPSPATSKPKRKRGRPRKAESALRSGNKDTGQTALSWASVRSDTLCGNEPLDYQEVPRSFPYRCTDCNVTYTVKYRFEMHLHRAHGAEEPQRQKLCTGCGKLFGTMADLVRHRRALHMEIPMMACPLCNKQIRKANLAPHLRTVHSGENYACAICGIILKNTKCLGAHMRGVHLKREARQCDWPGCGRMFNRQTHLNTHMLTHTGEMPIQCTLCNYRCRQTNSLNHHMRKTHMQNNQ